MYDNKKKVKKLHKEGKLKGWLFIVARNLFIDSKRNNKFIYNQGAHKNQGKPWRWNPQTYEVPDVHNHPNIKTFPDMLRQLTEIERLWIETYIECDFNYSELQRRTKIDRRHAKLRVELILNKWKHLDIYL